MKTHQNHLRILLLVILPALALSECTCDADTDAASGATRRSALRLKIAAFVAILVAGAVGISLPLIGKKVPSLSPSSGVFSVVKAFAGGVILATGAVHIAPDAFESLTSPCLSDKPWGEFPFTGLVMGVSMMGTMMIDVFASCCYEKNITCHGGHGHGESRDVEGRKDGGDGSTPPVKGDLSLLQLLQQRIIAQVLEMGIIVHSVIIGVDMGASRSPDTIKPLVAAITFHQFFEGMGLGGCIIQAKFKARTIAVMILFFALTTPAGILIGIGISKFYSETSPKALIVEGMLNAAAAGILFYMSLVDILSVNFNSSRLRGNLRMMSVASVAMVLGFGCMALLAIWA